jgi:hypothetical protein
MAVLPGELCDRLLTLRASLAEDMWNNTVQSPLIRLFNELVGQAKAICPADPILRSIEPATSHDRSRTLRALVDQLLVALDE